MRRFFVLGVLCALASGCLERELVSLNPCLVSGVARRIGAARVDKVDLLFVVDNSNSMLEEQAALKEQFPHLIRTLTSGVRSDGTKFTPVNLHLGVVSTDMGLAGIANPYGCDPQGGGDDGRLQRRGGQPGCKEAYPPFLSFELGQSDPDEVANDFACIATLGTGGCGFEQQLEAGLKALWPRHFVDAKGNAIPPEDNPITFLSTTQAGRFGHGDGSPAQGGNGGFLRNDAAGGASLVAIVIVSDEEDCSSIDTSHFTADRNDPRSQQPPNLRCFLNKQNLFEIERYTQGFKNLRPGNDDLVIFGAIVGVPEDLVDTEARARFDLQDDTSREAYYDAILADPRMQERPNGREGNLANLLPSCTGATTSGASADAYPPIRIVQVARGFGENGVVQSICQKDFGPAMDAIIDTIITKLAVCLPKPLVRKANGMVPCNVVWQLPPARDASPGVPTTCSAPGSFLEPVDPGRPAVNDRGGNNCKVRQLAVEQSRTAPAGQGWYYDDFAEELARQCKNKQQRVSFTDSAEPPNGVVVQLECVNETQRLASTDPRRMPDQPDVGAGCGELEGETTSEDKCMVQLKDGSQDHSLFCHPELKVCVQSCQGDSDCPDAWACDTRPDVVSKAEGKAFCVNPTCGSD
jgi:hypothetical protein